MRSTIRYVGMDVHKATITMAVADEGAAPPEVLATIPNHWGTLQKHLKRLGPKESLRCCYEAGPTGYGLYRQLESAEISCMVVAPALVPEQKGKRVKTDRRDAARLARFLRSGDLTGVYVPDEASEAIRDVVRARFDAKKAERTARQQLSHFLLRHGRTYTDGRAWTKKHLEWVRSQKLEHEGQQRVLVDYLHVVEEAGERIRALEDDIAELIQPWSLFELVVGLQALRGVSLIAAATVAAELGDLSRFESAPQLMGFVGLVPSEHSSGQSRKQGRITRTGNRNARWILVESAWSYRFSPRMGVEIGKRNEAALPEVKKIAWKAQQRLHRKYLKLLGRGKNKQQAMTAVARELVGFMWAISKQSKLVAD